jgi:tRNA wybutosine-synthesizing protein 1
MELENQAQLQKEGAATAKREPNVPKKLAEMMNKQGYRFVGRHSATKTCFYTTSSLKEGGYTCYKHQFYGIRSWRCIQATPAIGCNLACSFCWRIIPEDEGFKWNEMNAMREWDDPKDIVDGLIEEHRKLINGYKGNGKTVMKRWEEANDPAHVALSLTGEPLFYPSMNGLIEEFERRGISTFLVTNGTMVNALKNLISMPTQLYVSIQAPNKEVYGRTVRPKNIAATWDNFINFLKVFSGLRTRKVFRMTLVKGVNMEDTDGYAELIKVGKPDYVEVKGFVYVGGARNPKRNLEFSQMPTEDEIKNFAEGLADKSGYLYTTYHKHSNVVLLSRDEDAQRNRIIRFKK